MSDGYTKLFSSLIHSTVWQEDAFVKVVWITMLAMADRDGIVQASVPGLAKAAGVPLDACEAALEKFQRPDQYSRTPDNEGRRIGSVDGGWELLNYAKYRALMNAEDQREKAKVRKQHQRERDGHALSRSVTPGHECHDIAEAKAEAKAEAGPITETKIAAAAYCKPREPAAAAARMGDDQEIAAVIEAVLLEPRLRSIPRANVVDVVSHAMPVGKRLKLECYMRAVCDCARDTIDGEQAPETLRRLRKYLGAARPERAPPVEPKRYAEFKRDNIKPIDAAQQGELAAKIAGIGRGAA